MKDLFYSYHEGILFYISGYADTTTNVKDLISTLQNNYNYFERMAKTKQIHTDVITKSTRYKHMRVFWAETSECPSDALVLGEGEPPESDKKWTMRKWLEY